MTTADQNATSTLQITIPEKKESGAIQTDNPFSSFIKDLPYDSKGATIFRPMIRKLIGALVNQGMIETETYKYFSNLLDINDDALLKKMEQWTVVIISTELWIDSADKSQGKHIGLKLKLDDNSTLDLLHLKEFLNLRTDEASFLGRQIKSVISTHFVEKRTQGETVVFSKPLSEAKTPNNSLSEKNNINANKFLYQCLLRWYQKESPLSPENVRLHTPTSLQVRYFLYLFDAPEKNLVEKTDYQPTSPHIHISPEHERHFLFEGFRKPKEVKHQLSELGRHLSTKESLLSHFLSRKAKTSGPTATAITLTASIAIAQARESVIPSWGKKAMAACALLFSGAWLYSKAAELRRISSSQPNTKESNEDTQAMAHHKSP